MSWSTDQVCVLIDEYAKHPVLYNIKHRDYHNKYVRNIALRKIASVVSIVRPGTLEYDIKNKFSGLRTTYVSEHKRYLLSKPTGTDIDEAQVYKPSLWYFEKLSFLNAYLNIRWANSGYDDGPAIGEPPVQSYAYDHMENDDPLFVEVDVREVKRERMSPIVRDETPGAFYPSPEISSRSTTPAPSCKRAKFEAADSYRTQDEEQDGLYDTAKALSALTAAASTSSLNKDEDDIFSEYVCSRLKNITNRRKKLILRNKIEQLIFEVELEENA